VGLERGPLSLVSTIEKLLERKSSDSGLENREKGNRYPSHWPHGTLYLQKLAVSIVCSWTQTTEFVCFACHVSINTMKSSLYLLGKRKMTAYKTILFI
jgi:hypothetical protein